MTGQLKLTRSLLLLSLLLASACGGGYVLDWEAQGATFFDQFNFITYNDPSDGYVNYGLLSVTNGQVQLSTDTTNVVANSSRGRDSVRLESKHLFNGGLFVADVEHMPTGCGTWPAWWLYGPNWPTNGEIDIIEGVNRQTMDATTLHTNAGCNMTAAGADYMTGNYTSYFCDTNLGSGCGLYAPENSYGVPFNNVSGGVYILEWTDSYLKTWHFNRSHIPSDVTSGKPDPTQWGTPYGYFGLGAKCPASHFRNHTMTINLTFCGGWAGSVWQYDSVCSALASTCNSYVQNHPTAFKEAYWLFNSVRVYQYNSTYDPSSASRVSSPFFTWVS